MIETSIKLMRIWAKTRNLTEKNICITDIEKRILHKKIAIHSKKFFNIIKPKDLNIRKHLSPILISKHLEKQIKLIKVILAIEKPIIRIIFYKCLLPKISLFHKPNANLQLSQCLDSHLINWLTERVYPRLQGKLDRKNNPM